MKMHWQYLKYVIRHKWFVLIECFRFKLYWAGIIHDWQKFSPAEWTPYAQSFYGEWDYDKRPPWLIDSFNRAWLHHQHYGPHHWQYWILHEDWGHTVLLEMPDRYVLEMICDWIGAGRAISGKRDNVIQWYRTNRERIVLNPDTRHKVEKILWELFPNQ